MTILNKVRAGRIAWTESRMDPDGRPMAELVNTYTSDKQERQAKEMDCATIVGRDFSCPRWSKPSQWPRSHAAFDIVSRVSLGMQKEIMRALI